MDPEITTKMTELIITVVALFVSAYVIPWLKTKIRSDKLDQIKVFCEQAVRAAEQIYEPDEWLQKKSYVRDLVSDQVINLGIGLDEAEIDAIIEGVVNYVKHNRNGG